LLHDWTAAGLTPYEQAWAAQHAVLDQRLALRQQQEGGGNGRQGWWAGDRLFLLQHPPTYTLGTGSTPDNLRFDPTDAAGSPAALFRTERGGEATWHGPGQVGHGAELVVGGEGIIRGILNSHHPN
jgi:lipoyl(octanoyl) transferase